MSTQLPWYRRAVRWGQTNITELDPIRYDIAWWREHWKRTAVQGVIINAGGIVAYYPSDFELQYRAAYLGDRDLLGELVEAAREDGLAVVARMDSNRVLEAFYYEHPDWIAEDADGRPVRSGERYVTSIHGPYYGEYLPAVIREIASRYGVDGFSDNSWSANSRNHIDYSIHAQRTFRESTGLDLPSKPDWNDPIYRQWVKFSYARRLEVWDINNRASNEAGGPDCCWVGMNSGELLHQAAVFRDMKGLCERAPMIFLDYQSRRDGVGFYQNAEVGKLVHGLLGWDKQATESMAMYEHAPGQPYRLSAKSPAEARMWAISGLAGTITPWWHHIGAYHEDRRQYHTAEPVWQFHAKNEQYMVNRQPVASVGVVYSQDNIDFYGRDEPQIRVGQPRHGMSWALVRARVPYLPVHADHIERDSPAIQVMVLPNIGALSDAQVEALRGHVARGGSLVVSGETSLYDEWGQRRSDFGLADVLGVSYRGTHLGADRPVSSGWNDWSLHTYLRIKPEWRARTDGPMAGNEPPAQGERHPILDGFDETDILPFGGRMEMIAVQPGAVMPLTYIPPFTPYPPEFSYMRRFDSPHPAVVLRETPQGGRIAYLAADLDRLYGRANLPDHGRLLANIVRWAAGDSIPLEIEGPGIVDCSLYRQPGRYVLHLVNLTGTEARPLYENLPVGPFTVRVKLGVGENPGNAQLLVSETARPVKRVGKWAEIVIDKIVDHEVVVLQ